MISEPELEGEMGPPDGPDTLADDDPTPKRPRREVPRWGWAVGGALLASALWAGGLYVAGLDDGVDTRGYKVEAGLCAEVKLRALAGELGQVQRGGPQPSIRHSALDRAECPIALVPKEQAAEDGFSLSYDVRTVVELHKKTDPEPEFEATAVQSRWPGMAAAQAKEAVPGLGEKAYFVKDEDAEELQLKVLDGGAVITFHVVAALAYNGDVEDAGEGPSTDLNSSTLRPLMVKDARDLMAALKR